MRVENNLKEQCNVALSTIGHNQHKNNLQRLSETVLSLLELRTMDFPVHYSPVMTKVKS